MGEVVVGAWMTLGTGWHKWCAVEEESIVSG